jgi:hypothetical protein
MAKRQPPTSLTLIDMKVTLVNEGDVLFSVNDYQIERDGSSDFVIREKDTCTKRINVFAVGKLCNSYKYSSGNFLSGTRPIINGVHVSAPVRPENKDEMTKKVLDKTIQMLKSLQPETDCLLSVIKYVESISST